MASEQPQRPNFNIPGARSGSAPAETTQAIEQDGLTAHERIDNLARSFPNKDRGVLSSSASTMLASHPILTSHDCEAVAPTDSAPLPSAITSPHQDQHGLGLPIPTVKMEPAAFEVMPGADAIPLAPSTDSTTLEAVLKSEPPSDPSPTTQFSQPPKAITLNCLRGVADSMDLVKLQAGVAAAQEVLDQLRTPLQDFKQHQELHDWLSLIDNLKVKAQKAGRTVIAVAGGTGAGKSSLINAVLEEEKLLPTNGMRACTAVITEVLWNEVDDPERAYRAEIEFISCEEWDTELKILFDELLDENKQISPAWRDPNSEAGIAYAKVKSVYPNLTHEMIMKSSPKELAQVGEIKKVLGTKQQFGYSSAEALYSNLSTLIDSKEKDTSRQKKAVTALWPIIRVVRIFVRAKALSTGVVLVDLPGTADNNAARSAVASKYMAECTAVWVVARITRAVDDKAAHELLGRSSRIQMKLDGAYSHLSFVATQTDSINIRETIDTLDDDGQIQATFTREDEIDALIQGEKAGTHLDRQVDDLADECDSLGTELNVWEALQKNHKKGQQVFPPAPKRATKTKRRRILLRKREELESDDEPTGVPLTQDEITAKLKELEMAFDTKLAQYEAAQKAFETAKNKLQELQQKKGDIAVERAWMCVDKRNTYCRDAIRTDFAAGIREIDEEDGSADASYDPAILRRDYDQVARSLEVFCISSKAYQQLRSNIYRGETKVEGFRSVDDTDIPRLQRYALNSSQAGQIRSNKVYLNQFSQVMNSLTVWTMSNELAIQSGHTGKMSEESKTYEMKYLDVQVQELKTHFADLVFQMKTELFGIIRSAYIDRSSSASKFAAKELENIAIKWGQTEKDGGFGIVCQTYRAICKRGGEKTASRKARNFNEDVANPFLQKIASSWDQAFSRTIPATLDTFVVAFVKELEKFHALIASRPDMQKGRTASLAILADQIINHEATIKEAINNAKTQIIAEQRNASRLFFPEVKSSMQKIYAQCSEMKGSGTYQRMKDAMIPFIKKKKNSIFSSAGRRVQKNLETAFQLVANSLADDCEHIRGTLANDYKLVLTSAETIEANAVVREYIREVLQSADNKFEAILVNAELMDIDPVV